MAYDTIVIGGNLTGLLLTHLLYQDGQNVALLEARDSLGGRWRQPSPNMPFSSASLDFIPATGEQLDTLEWLKAAAPSPVTWKVQDHQPQALQEGHWKTFVGFGESEHKSVSELSFYNHQNQVILDQGLENLSRVLCEQLPIEAQLRNEVTGFVVKDHRVTGVVVNGDKTLEAKQFIFCPPPQMLNNLFVGEDLPNKHRTRLAKSKSWTVLLLKMEHQNALNGSTDVRHLLSGAKDFEPVVGIGNGKNSKWLMMLDDEQAEDHEYIGSCFKHIKRLVKRAFPESEPIVSEKFYVQPFGSGHVSLKNKSPYVMPELPNLYLAHPSLASVPGDLAGVQSAQGVWQEMKGLTPAAEATSASSDEI